MERGAEHRGTAGRPGLVVDVARDGVVALGLEVNVDYVGVQATDLAGGSRYKAMEAADNRGRDVEEVLDRLGELDARRAGRGAGAGAAADRGDGRAARAWSTSSTARCSSRRTCTGRTCRSSTMLRERIDAPSLPLGVDNEANLAALAELWEGAATGISDFVYASGEIGVGGGIVLGGELFRGYRGFGGEFGHTTVEPTGCPARAAAAAAWRRAPAWSRCSPRPG